MTTGTLFLKTMPKRTLDQDQDHNYKFTLGLVPQGNIKLYGQDIKEAKKPLNGNVRNIRVNRSTTTGSTTGTQSTSVLPFERIRNRIEGIKRRKYNQGEAPKVEESIGAEENGSPSNQAALMEKDEQIPQKTSPPSKTAQFLRNLLSRSDFGEAKRKPEKTEDVSLKAQQVPAVSEWTCSKCLIENYLTNCVVCGLAKPKEKVKTEQTKVSTGMFMNDAFKPKTDVWSCSVCLTENNNKATQCAACESPNSANVTKKIEEVKVAQPVPAVSGSMFMNDAFKPKTDIWSCSVCLTENKKDAIQCAACENPNPSKAVAKTEAKPAVPVAPVVSGSMFLNDAFKPKSDVWNCDICCTENKKDAAQCAACENPNPSAPKVEKETPKEFKPSVTNITFGGFNPQPAAPASSSSSLFNTGFKPSVAVTEFTFGGKPVKSTTEAKAEVSSGFKFEPPSAPAKQTSFFNVSKDSNTPVKVESAAKVPSPTKEAEAKYKVMDKFKFSECKMYSLEGPFKIRETYTFN